MYVIKKFQVYILNSISHEIPITLEMQIPYEELYIQKKFFNLFDIYDADPLTFLVHFNSTRKNKKNNKNIYAYYKNGWSLKYSSTSPLVDLQPITKKEVESLYDPLKNIFSKLFIKKPKTIEFFNLFCLFNHLESLNLPVPIKTENHLRRQMISFLKEYKNLNNNLNEEEIHIQIRNFFPFNLYGNFYTQMFYFLLLFNDKKYKNLKNFLSYLILSTFEFNNLNEVCVNKLIEYIKGDFCFLTKLGFTDIFDKNISYLAIIVKLKYLIKEGYNKPSLVPPSPLNKMNFNIEPSVLNEYWNESVYRNNHSVEKHKECNTEKEKINDTFKLVVEVYKPSFDTLRLLNIPIKNGYIQIEPSNLNLRNVFYKKFFVTCKVIYEHITPQNRVDDVHDTSYPDKFENTSLIKLTEIVFLLNGVKFNKQLQTTLC